MKKKQISVVLVCALVAALAALFAVGASAQPAPNGNSLWFAAKATTEPVIDGEIDEIWSSTVAMAFETESYGYIKALWLEQSIFLLAEVNGCTQVDFLLSTRFYNSTDAGTWSWGGNYGLTCTPTTDSSDPGYTATSADFIAKTWNGWAYSGANKTATKAVAKAKATETGFVVEVMIPLSASTEYKKNGSFMGLGAYVNGDCSVGNCVGIATTDREDALGLKKSPYALYAVATYDECPHKVYSEATCIAPATCLGCGKTKGEPDPDNHAEEAEWVITDEKHSLVYPCCGAIAEEGEHSWSEVKVDTEPTCTETGESSRHCTDCDARTDITELPALGHDFSEAFTVDAEPDCTHAGSQSRHCSRCDAVTDESEIPALGHDFAAEFTVDVTPDCTHNGSESRHCSRCAEVTDVRRIDALGHDFGDWITIKEATCAEPGLRHKTCSRCWLEGEVETVTVPHTADEWIVESEAQPGVAGSRYRVCTVCGAKFDREEIPALPVEPEKPSGGCGSALSVSAWTVGLLLLPAVHTVARRKRKKETER